MEPKVVTGVDSARASSRGASGHHELTVHTLDELLSLADGLLAESAVRDLAAARDARRRGPVQPGRARRVQARQEHADQRAARASRAADRGGPADVGRDRDRRGRSRPAAWSATRRPRGGAPARRACRLCDRRTEPGQPPGCRAGARRARPRVAARGTRAGRHPRDRLDSQSQHGGRARVSCPRVDAAICVLDAGQPLSRGRARAVPGRGGGSSPASADRDQQDRSPRARRPRRWRSSSSAPRCAICSASDNELFALSARRREGLSRLARRLRRLAAEEREALLAELGGPAGADRGRGHRAGGAVRVPRDPAPAGAAGIAGVHVRATDRGPQSGDRRGRRPARPRDRARAGADRSTSRSSSMRGARRPGCGRSYASMPTG